MWCAQRVEQSEPVIVQLNESINRKQPASPGQAGCSGSPRRVGSGDDAESLGMADTNRAQSLGLSRVAITLAG